MAINNRTTASSTPIARTDTPQPMMQPQPTASDSRPPRLYAVAPQAQVSMRPAAPTSSTSAPAVTVTQAPELRHGSADIPQAAAATLAKPKAIPLCLLRAVEDQDVQGLNLLIGRMRRQEKNVATALNQRGRLRDADGNLTSAESTPLLTAVRLGNASLAATLVEAGADWEQADAEGRTALTVAIEHGDADLVDALLEAGARVDGKNRGPGFTPIMHAVAAGNADLVKVLLGWAAELNHISACGWTALTLATRGGYLDIVSLLVHANADVDLCDCLASGGLAPHEVNNETALTIAADQGHIAILKLLLQAGAKIDQSTSNGRTALMVAAKNGHTATVQALLQAGAKVDHTGAKGAFALKIAAGNGHTTTVQALLHAGAKVDMCEYVSSDTALMAAAENGHTSTVQALLRAGADWSLRGSYGQTALAFANAGGHKEVIELLRAHGATE